MQWKFVEDSSTSSTQRNGMSTDGTSIDNKDSNNDHIWDKNQELEINVDLNDAENNLDGRKKLRRGDGHYIDSDPNFENNNC